MTSGHNNQTLPPAQVKADGEGSAQSKPADIAGQAQSTVQRAAGQAQEKLREQLDQRSAQAATQISEQVSDLRSVGQALREQGKEGPAKAADRLAGHADRVGEYLREKDPDQLLADLEDLGRRQPWAVAAGGLALGVAASRFLKASSSRRYQNRSEAVTPGPRPEPAGNPPESHPGNGLGAELPLQAPRPGNVPVV